MRMVTAVRSLVLAAAAALVPAASQAGIFVSIGFGAPPPLPVYVQPDLPAPGYLWTPGYWSYDEDGGYYWVPGAWVLAPYPGALWTPGYWAYQDSGYGWNPGYWGLHIGFYGGVNYGCGYYGRGFEGGYWDSDRYFYNRSVTNITNVNVVNVYNQTVVNNYNNNVRTSFVGGNGGLQVRPTPQELNYSREQHVAPLPAQRQNEQRAVQSRQQFVALNHGQPPVVARAQPVVFNRTAANLPGNRGTMQPLRTPSLNNGVRASLPAANPAANGQRPLITAHPVTAAPVNAAPVNAGRFQSRPAPPDTQTYNRPQQPVFNQPRPANPLTNGSPARPQQPVYNRPQPAPVYQQPRASGPASGYPERPQQTYSRPQAPVYNQRPVEAPQYHQPAQPQYRPQPEQRQQAQPQYRPEQRQQAQPQYRPEPRQQAQPQYRQPEPQQQSRPQEFHGAPAGGHGGHGGR